MSDSTTIDQKIVEMEFDNSGFEKNVSQSISTLDKLKSSLNMQGSADSLNEIDRAANNINLGSLYNAVENISNRFSTMGIIASTAISNITTSVMNGVAKITSSLYDLTVSGGISRAMNIEKAKFQLEGLNIAWEDITDDLSYAVNETAYSLDAAATAASVLAATGIQIGDVAKTITTVDDAGNKTKITIDSMAMSLRAISGVAAQTSSDYESISNIFSTIAGNGRIMGSELTQLSHYGLNAAADLADALGKTESEVRDMVSDGKISYSQFVEVMFDKYAEHAVAANKTVTGILSNIRAAFAKIGAEFVEPIIANEGPLVEMLNSFKNKVDTFKASLIGDNDLSTSFVTVAIDIINRLNSAINSISDSDITNIGSSLNYIFNGLVDILSIVANQLNIVKNAFGFFFPKTSTDAILKATEAFSSFTTILKYSSKDSEELKSIRVGIEGLFAVADICKQALTALLIPLKTLWDVTDPIRSGLLGLIEAFGNYTIELDKSLKANETFAEIGQGISDVIVLISDKIENLSNNANFTTFKESILDIVSAIQKAFGNFNIDTSNWDSFSETIINDFNPLTTVLSVFASVFSGIAWTISNVGGILVTVFNTVAEAMGNFFKTLKDAIANSDLSEVETMFEGGLFAFVLYTLKDLINALKNFFNSISVIKDGGITNMLSQVRESLFAWQRDLQADALIKLAKAVGILVLSLVVLSGLDVSSMQDGIAAISALMGVLVTGITAFSKLNKLDASSINMSNKKGILGVIDNGISKILVPNKITAASAALVNMAIAVGVLAISLKVVSTIPSDKIASSVVAMTTMMAAIVAGTVILNKAIEDYKGLIKSASAMLIIANAMVVLGAAVAIFSLTSWNGIAKAGASLGGITAALIALSYEIPKGNGLVSAGASILLIANAMVVLGAAVAIFSALSWDGLAKGGSALTALVVALALLTCLSNDIAAVVAAAGSMLIIANAMAVLGAAAAIFSAISWGGLAKSGVVLVVFTAAAIALSQLATSLPLAASGLLIFSAALAVFVPAFMLLANLNPDQISLGLIALAGSLATIIVAGNAAEGAAAGILTLTAALIGIGVGISLVGVGVLAIGTGLVALGTGIVTVATSIVGSAGIILLAIKSILVGAVQLIPDLVIVFVAGITAIAQVIIECAPVLAQAGITIIEDFLLAIVAELPTILNTVLEIIAALISGISDNLPTIVSALVELVISVIDSVASAIEQGASGFGEAIGHLINAIITSIPDAIGGLGKGLFGGIFGGEDQEAEVSDSVNSVNNAALSTMDEGLLKWTDKGTELTQNTADGVTDGTDNLVDSVKSMFNTAQTDGFDTSDWENMGLNIDTGIATGINSNRSVVTDAIHSLGLDSLGTYATTIDSNSPSKEFAKLGKYSAQGVAVGLNKYASTVTEATSSLGKKSLETLSATVKTISALLTTDMDSAPVITPVLDLSNVRYGSSAINNLLGASQSLSLAGNVSANLSEIQNGESSASEIASTLRSLGRKLDSINANNYTINGITYDDGSNVASAVQSLVRAARVERRM